MSIYVCDCRFARAEKKGKDWAKGYFSQLLPCQPQDSKETEGVFWLVFVSSASGVLFIHCSYTG